MKSFIAKKFSSLTECVEFFRNKELYSFNNEDYNLILRIKEFEQKEAHHKQLIHTKLKVGRAIQRAINGQAGLPMDMC